MADDYGWSMFFGYFAFSLFCIAIVHLFSSDINLTLFLLGSLFVVSLLLGILTSKSLVSVKSYRVVVTTVDDGVYYLGRDLSWANAKKLRDDAVRMFESSEVMLSVRCKNSNDTYSVRSFVKSNIVHIGWLED